MDRIIAKKTSWRSRWIKAGIAFILVTSAALMFYGFSEKEYNVSAERLTIESVKYDVFQEYIPLNGVVEPIKSIYIDVVEGGKVEEIFVEDGREIEMGVPIIRLTNQQFQMDAIQRESQLLDQQNNLRNSRIQMDQQTSTLRAELLKLDYDIQDANREFMMNEKLFQDSAISKVEYEKSKERLTFLKKSRQLNLDKLKMDSLFRLNQTGQIESSLSLVHRNLHFLDETVENLVVKAPISGILSQLQVELGQSISPGSRIGQIDDMSELKIRSSVAEHYVSRVIPGLSAVIKVDNLEFPLVVSKVYPEVTNGQFNIDLVFVKEKPASIRRGQTLQLTLALGEKGEALQVPRGAYFQQTGGNWIFILQENGKAVRREIKLGRQNADYYEVLDGLQSGDQVITSRYDLFGDAEVISIESQ
ncbi:MAG: efflux RND transporter periplasmic adaptor subunit [Flavobacteriales bacterium]|nr:efflux RND transporter periplasmic adaptor subunit [Flavobacteriales bacterium]